MGGTKSPGCNQIAYNIWDWCVNNNSWITATYIAGVENTEADKDSRLLNDRTEWTVKGRFLLRLSPTGEPQKLTYLQLDLIHNSPSLSLGNLTQPHVLWRHLQLVEIHCIVMLFSLSVKFTDACKRLWRNKYLRESRLYLFGPPKFWQVWWPQLLKMLIAIQFLLPKQEELLSLSHSPQTLHPLRRKLTMLACLMSGISEAAANLIMASWGDGTKKQYSTYNTKWQKFCNQRHISHIQPSVVSVLDFLTLLYQQGLTHSELHYSSERDMCRTTPTSIPAYERHFPGKTTKA